MNEYIVDGQLYQVSNDLLDSFLKKYPNAQKSQSLGKMNDPVKETAIAGSQNQAVNMESKLGDGSSEFIKLENELKKLEEEFKLSGGKGPLNSREAILIRKKLNKAKEIKPIPLEEVVVQPNEKLTGVEKTFGMNPITNAIGDLQRSWKSGNTTGSTLDNALEIYKPNTSKEEIESFLADIRAMENAPQTDEMIKFGKDYEERKEKLGGFRAFFSAWADNPTIMAQYSAQSLGMMVGSFMSSEEARGAVAGAAGTGAAIGGVTAGPAGAIAGGLSGTMGALSATMEVGFTTSDILQEVAIERTQLKGGKDWSQMNDNERLTIVEELLNDPQTKQDITNRALRRGLTIGLIDAATGALVPGIASTTTKATTKSFGKAAGRGLGVGAAATSETTGGLASEIGGQYAAGQEFDAREILTEGFADKTFTAVEVGKATANISPIKTLKDAVTKSVSIPSYKINGETVTTEKFKQTIKGMDDMTFLATKIEVNNDPIMSKIIDNRQRDISIDSQIDPKINDIKDRSDLIKLERDLMLLKNNETKSASNKRNEINSKIKDITDKYKDVETDPIDVISRSVAIANAARTRIETEFNINAKKITEAAKDVEGLEIKTFDNTDQVNNYLKEIGQDIGDTKASEQQGFIIQRSDGTQEIILNKEQAVQDRAVTVAQHEFLHAVLFKTIKNNDATAINLGESLLAELDKIDASQVANSDFKKRLEQYKQDGKAIEMEEALTLFSDAVANGDIKFNESVFTKLQDLIRRVLQAAGVNVKFNTGRDVYNFIKDYNRSIEKTGKLTTAQQKVASEGAKGKLVEQGTKQDADIVKESKIASDNVQNIYNEKGVDGAFDIIEQFNPIINKLVQRRSEAPNFNRQDLTDAIKYDDRGILGLIRSYDPKSNVPLAAYVNKFLPSRMIEASNKILGEEFTLDVAEAKGVAAQETETTVEQPVSKKIKPSSLLKNKQAAVSKIKQGIKNVDPKNLTFKKLKDLSPDTTAEIFEVPAKKVTDPKANLNKGDLSNAARNINKNADKLLRLLPEGAVVEAASEKLLGTSTGVPKSLLDVFYTKQERLSRGAGLSPYKLNSVNRQQFLEALGIENGKLKEGLSPRSPEAQRIKAIMNLTGKLITNELVRSETNLSLEQKQDIGAGRSRLMFSRNKIQSTTPKEKPVTSNDKLFASEAEETIKGRGKPINKLFKFRKYKETFDLQTKDGIDNFIETLKVHVLPYFPKDFFFSKKSTMRNSDRIAGKEMDSYYQEQLEKLRNDKTIKYGKEFNVDNYSQSSYDTMIGTPEKIIENLENGKIDEWNKKNMQIHKEMWERTYEASVQDGKINKEAVRALATFYSFVGNDRNHPHRLGAEFVGYSFNPKRSGEGKIYEMEHAMPATGAYVYLFDSILTGRDFKADYNAIVDNYKLIALDASDNYKLAKGGVGTSMPNGWKVMSNFWWQRYFNKNVAKFDGGIDPDSIVFTDNESVGKKFNIEANGEFANQDVAKRNNNLLPGKNKIKYSKKNKPNNKEVIEKLDQIDKANIEASKARTAEADINKEFNQYLEDATGIGAEKVFNQAKAEARGSKVRKSFGDYFIPPGAEDFGGLMHKTLAKGKKGEKQLEFYKKYLYDPYNAAMESITREKSAMMNDFMALKKQFSNVPKRLKKFTKGGDYTNDQAVRVYAWTRQGMEIPGLSKKDIRELVNEVKNDKELLFFATELINITKGDGYPKPQESWMGGNVAIDLMSLLNGDKRSKHLEAWQNNVDILFSKENMFKLEAAYGKNWVKNVKATLERMKNGSNRKWGGDKNLQAWNDWVNGSVGTIMFLNSRSAVLQTISNVNYLNFKDNNPLAAAKAFANQPQYWADFVEIFNSDYLQERRGGNKININESELALAAEKGGVQGTISYLLNKGFILTKMADSFAIASGGAPMYRNRIKTYMKQGMPEADAKKQAFLDFKAITEETQQSSRPDRISEQQAGNLGRFMLAFANTPMQYNRIIKRNAQDLVAGRGNPIEKVSKIIYYSTIQNFIFNAMQKALFAIAFDEDEDDEKKISKASDIGNGMADSLLRGSGLTGNAIVAAKNVAMEIAKQSKKPNPDFQQAAWKTLTVSPPLYGKLTRLRGAGYSMKYVTPKNIFEPTLDNPALSAAAQTTSAAFNLPLDRALRKAQNIEAAMSDEAEWWQSAALLMGWGSWELGMEQETKKPKKISKTLRKNILKRSNNKLRKLR